MLIMSLLGLPRAMWAGIACMSVCLPFTEDCKGRAGKRGMFNIVGCILFAVLYLILPESMYPYIGMIGGIGVGYSAVMRGRLHLIHLEHCPLHQDCLECRQQCCSVLEPMYLVQFILCSQISLGISLCSICGYERVQKSEILP